MKNISWTEAIIIRNTLLLMNTWMIMVIKFLLKDVSQGIMMKDPHWTIKMMTKAMKGKYTVGNVELLATNEGVATTNSGPGIVNPRRA